MDTLLYLLVLFVPFPSFGAPLRPAGSYACLLTFAFVPSMMLSMEFFSIELILIFLLPSIAFGALVMPRIGQTLHALLGLSLCGYGLMYRCALWKALTMALLIAGLTAAAFAIDRYCRTHDVWQPQWQPAIKGGALGFLLLMIVCPVLPPVWCFGCFFGAYFAERHAAHKQNAAPAALRRYQTAVGIKMILFLFMYAACYNFVLL